MIKMYLMVMIADFAVMIANLMLDYYWNLPDERVTNDFNYLFSNILIQIGMFIMFYIGMHLFFIWEYQYETIVNVFASVPLYQVLFILAISGMMFVFNITTLIGTTFKTKNIIKLNIFLNNQKKQKFVKQHQF